MGRCEKRAVIYSGQRSKNESCCCCCFCRRAAERARNLMRRMVRLYNARARGDSRERKTRVRKLTQLHFPPWTPLDSARLISSLVYVQARYKFGSRASGAEKQRREMRLRNALISGFFNDARERELCVDNTGCFSFLFHRPCVCMNVWV